MRTKPKILITFADGVCPHTTSCTWASVGWQGQPELMKLARAAINEGATKAEVIELLRAAGFEILGHRK
jgi:hypothetical protein